jgi:hypothetical protein
MSTQQKETLNFIGNWLIRVVLGIAAYLLISMTSEMRSDLKTVLLNQEVQKEKMRRVERVIDKLEDKGLK